MITTFLIRHPGLVEKDEVSFSTDTAPTLANGSRIFFEKLPITHPSRRKHLILDGMFNVLDSRMVFRRNGLIQEIELVVAENQTLEWTENS